MSTIVFILPFLIFYLIMVVYAERKISAFMQDRLGPMEVGYYGLLQTIADLLKLLQKEDLVPAAADRILFKVAPIVIFLVIFAGFSVVPLSSEWSGAGLQTGVFFLLAIISLDVIGIILAGWSSGNKYSSLGAFRAIAQIISYEVPLTLTVLCVAMFNGTLDLQKISFAQSSDLGIVGWNVVQMPFLLVAWVIFFIASLAESNRAPFDLPEAESELVAGFHTEYSGFRWAILMLAEYAMMLLVSMLGAVLFFGSWNSPLPGAATNGPIWGVCWLILKSVALTVIQVWVRWTYPRVRIDQLMNLSWKYLTPAALVLVIITGFWKLWLS
jgi:NADH-quinone oxidoreductase subunit H